MSDPFASLEEKLAACRPVLLSADRDQLLFEAAQAILKKSYFQRTVSYSLVSSLASAAAFFGLMTLSFQATDRDIKIANSPQAIPASKVAEYREGFTSDFQSERERRPRGVLTATSWNRWKSIEEMDLDVASTASEPMSGEDTLPSESLSVRSRILSF
jgi:hypothetical protein